MDKDWYEPCTIKYYNCNPWFLNHIKLATICIFEIHGTLNNYIKSIISWFMVHPNLCQIQLLCGSWYIHKQPLYGYFVVLGSFEKHQIYPYLWYMVHPKLPYFHHFCISWFKSKNPTIHIYNLRDMIILQLSFIVDGALRKCCHFQVQNSQFWAHYQLASTNRIRNQDAPPTMKNILEFDYVPQIINVYNWIFGFEP